MRKAFDSNDWSAEAALCGSIMLSLEAAGGGSVLEQVVALAIRERSRRIGACDACCDLRRKCCMRSEAAKRQPRPAAEGSADPGAQSVRMRRRGARAAAKA